MTGKRTVIDIAEYRRQRDREEKEFTPFIFPEYQRDILWTRLFAGLTDMGIIALTYVIFLAVIFVEIPAGSPIELPLIVACSVGFLLLAGVYSLLFMLTSGQTPGMKVWELIVVTPENRRLDRHDACLRGLGDSISSLALMLGFIWALVDPEHLTWADKFSGTYVKRI